MSERHTYESGPLFKQEGILLYSEKPRRSEHPVTLPPSGAFLQHPDYFLSRERLGGLVICYDPLIEPLSNCIPSSFFSFFLQVILVRSYPFTPRVNDGIRSDCFFPLI